MRQNYTTSLSAYILLNKVKKQLNIQESHTESIKNGNLRNILECCNRIIEKRYHEEEQQIKLKNYVENIFYIDKYK